MSDKKSQPTSLQIPKSVLSLLIKTAKNRHAFGCLQGIHVFTSKNTPEITIESADGQKLFRVSVAVYEPSVPDINCVMRADCFATRICNGGNRGLIKDSVDLSEISERECIQDYYRSPVKYPDCDAIITRLLEKEYGKSVSIASGEYVFFQAPIGCSINSLNFAVCVQKASAQYSIDFFSETKNPNGVLVTNTRDVYGNKITAAIMPCGSINQ